jgi:hypothetical protein
VVGVGVASVLLGRLSTGGDVLPAGSLERTS